MLHFESSLVNAYEYDWHSGLDAVCEHGFVFVRYVRLVLRIVYKVSKRIDFVQEKAVEYASNCDS